LITKTPAREQLRLFTQTRHFRSKAHFKRLGLFDTATLDYHRYSIPLFDGGERTGVLYNECHRPRGDEQTLLAMHAVSVRCLTEQSILFRKSLEKRGTHSKAAECGGLDRYSPQKMSSHARLAGE
jgi:hypothetical protein